MEKGGKLKRARGFSIGNGATSQLGQTPQTSAEKWGGRGALRSKFKSRRTDKAGKITQNLDLSSDASTELKVKVKRAPEA